MEIILFFVNLFIIPWILFFVLYLKKDGDIKLWKALLIYVIAFLSVMISTLILLGVINFIFSQSYGIYNIQYTVISMIATLIISYFMKTYNFKLSFISENCGGEKVEEQKDN